MGHLKVRPEVFALKDAVKELLGPVPHLDEDRNSAGPLKMSFRLSKRKKQRIELRPLDVADGHRDGAEDQVDAALSGEHLVPSWAEDDKV